MTTASPAKGTALPWSGLLALSTAAFTAVLTELLPAGLLPRMAPALGVSEARVGFLVTGYAVASFLAAIPVTAALRGLPRRPVLIGTLLGFACADAVVALSSSYAVTFGARLLAGVMGGTMWAMLAGYAARMVPAERRGRAIAVVLAGITLALSLGIPAGTALADAIGWRPAFGTLSGLALLVVVWIRHRVPAFPGELPGVRVPLRRVAVLPGIPTVLSVTLFLLLGHQVMYTYVAPFTAHTGYGRTDVVLLVFGAATVVGIWATGALVDCWARPTLLGALTLIVTVMCVLALFADSPAVLLTSVAAWGVAFGGAPTLIQTALVNASGPQHADVATSLQTTVYNAGIAGGSFTGGLALSGWGAGALPWTALPLVAIALTVVSLDRRHKHPRRGAGSFAPSMSNGPDHTAPHGLGPFLEESAQAGPYAVGGNGGGETRRLDRQALVDRQVDAAGDRAQAGGYGRRCVPDDPSGQVLPSLQERVGRHDGVDEAQFGSPDGRDLVAGQDHLQSALAADVPRQSLGTAEGRREPEGDLGLGEGRVLGGDRERGGLGDLAAAAVGETVDRDDHRLGELLDPPGQRVAPPDDLAQRSFGPAGDAGGE